MGICELRIAVAIGAGDFFRRCCVAQAFDVLMAINTGEHAAVDRVRELGAIDIEADSFAVVSVGQSFVRVAREAVFVFEFMFGAGR